MGLGFMRRTLTLTANSVYTVWQDLISANDFLTSIVYTHYVLTINQ